MARLRNVMIRFCRLEFARINLTALPPDRLEPRWMDGWMDSDDVDAINVEEEPVVNQTGRL